MAAGVKTHGIGSDLALSTRARPRVSELVLRDMIVRVSVKRRCRLRASDRNGGALMGGICHEW